MGPEFELTNQAFEPSFVKLELYSFSNILDSSSGSCSVNVTSSQALTKLSRIACEKLDLLASLVKSVPEDTLDDPSCFIIGDIKSFGTYDY